MYTYMYTYMCSLWAHGHRQYGGEDLGGREETSVILSTIKTYIKN